MGRLLKADASRHEFRASLFLLHAGLIVAFVLSGGAYAKDKETAEVKFTSRTELVLIPAVVTDKSGAHISGLKKEDFTVLENGSERSLDGSAP